jgi:tetratricopeptide (TPR) repeat protein
MRIAMVATPLPLSDMRPAPGFLDGDLVRARLPLADAGFRVVDLDPGVDLAEQIEQIFESGEASADASVFFYASSRVMLSDDGELFLTLDSSQPDTGDSLRDIALLVRERVRGPVAFFLECRHAPDPEDPFRSAAVVSAAKECVAAASGTVELLVAANPVAEDDDEDRASALTRAFIEAMDEPEAQYGLTLARFFGTARESAEIATQVRCFAHAKATPPFDLLPETPRPPARPGSEPMLPPTAAEPEPEPEPEERVHEAVAQTNGAAKPRTPYPSVEIAVELPDAELDAPASPPPPSAPPSSSKAGSAVLPEDRSFRRSETPPPRVILSAPVSSGSPVGVPQNPPVASTANPVAIPQNPPAHALRVVEAVVEAPPISSERLSEAASSGPSSYEGPRRSGAASKAIAASDHVTLGNALKDAGDLEAALASYKRALGMLAPTASLERADIFVRLGQLKELQDKRREAIANYEKALALFPPLAPGAELPEAQRVALEARLDLHVKEGDLRGVAAAEDALLAALPAEEHFDRLVSFGRRWHDETRVLGRARAAFERARAIKDDDPGVLERLASLYEEAGMVGEALVTGQRLAELTRDPRERAERYFKLGKRCIGDLRKDDLGLKLFDLALESDPTMLEPLALVARVLAERQEWSELEKAYRRMLDRMDAVPQGPVRRDVTFELCKRLGLLFRDHLEDPALGLDAFEDALHAKPGDLATVLTTAELARSLGELDRAAQHLAQAAALDPRRLATYHELFDLFQKLRRPDQAFQAATVTVHLGQAESRERFIFEEHKQEGLPKPTFPMPTEGWAWIKPRDREALAEAVLAAITPAAIAVRLASLSSEGRLPALDPSLRQDVERSTVSIVRSFGWASHFLAVPAPAIYLNDDPQLALAAVIAEEPTVMVGTKAQRGRSPTELAFLVGRHLAYHVGPHRLLLYYPSMEDLTAVFLAAIRIVLPEVPSPASLRGAVNELQRGISLRMSEAHRVDLAAAVAAFEAGGSRVHLADWAGDVERCATRAGFVLASDLGAASRILAAEPRQVLEAEEKIADLCAFAVSEEHHALRESLGIAIQP